MDYVLFSDVKEERVRYGFFFRMSQREDEHSLQTAGRETNVSEDKGRGGPLRKHRQKDKQ